LCAGVAQSAEQLSCKQQVNGSSPFVGSDRWSERQGLEDTASVRKYITNLGGCPSGQRELTVNQPAIAYDGSNPSPPTMEEGSIRAKSTRCFLRVLFTWLLHLFPAHIAQSVEHILGKNEVIGSSPIVGSPMFVTMPARGLHEAPGCFLRLVSSGCAFIRVGTGPPVWRLRIAGRKVRRLGAQQWARHKQFGCLQKKSKEAFFQCPSKYLSGQSPM
jgi:hypothetical protein